MKKVKSEGFERVAHGSLSKGDLPQSTSIHLDEWHLYKIYAIPFGKLKTIEVRIDYQRYLPSTKKNPVFECRYASRTSEKAEFRVLNPKKKGRFKLSPDNSVYYIIAKKPLN